MIPNGNSACKILIVDDDPDLLRISECLLRRQNYIILTAVSGQGCLQAIRRDKPDLLLLDVMLPDISGIEVCKIIKGEPGLSTIHILLISGMKTQSEIIAEGLDTGADGYLLKPLRNKEFLARVDAAFRTIKAEKALRVMNWRMNSIIEATHAGTWEWNIQTGETIFNERWAEIIGYTLDEISPVSIDTWTKFSHPDDLKVSGELLEKHFKGVSDYYECEARMKHKNGNWIWILDRGRVQEWDKEGKPLLMSGTHTDITLRHHNEERTRYQANLLENVSDAIIATDMQFNIQYWNKMAEEQYGWTASEVIGQPFSLFITNDYLGGDLNDILRKISESGHWKGEVTQKRRDGTSIPVISYLSIITNSANKQSGYISVNHDITAIKKAEVDLRLYGEILENMDEGIFLVRAIDGVIVYTNRKAYQMFGYDSEELVGKHISIIYAPSEKHAEEAAMEITRKLNIDGVWKDNIKNIRKDGIICWCNAIVSSLEHVQHGKLWISIHQDITELKMAEQAMIISEEKYRTTLDASPDGVFLIDINGVITDISEIGIQLFGVSSRDEMVGKYFSQFIPDGEQNIIKTIIEKTTNEGLVQNIELKIQKENQSLFLGEISSTLIQDQQGEPLSFMITIRDISRRKKTEALQFHADRMANIGEMASGIAHEINQPLNIISLIMDKLLFEAAKTETIEIDFFKTKSDKIFENITRIRNIIDHVRAFSEKHDDLVQTTFNINASIENAVSMIIEQFKPLGISLNCQLEKQVPPVNGNIYRFEQVIINLLINAKDAVIERKSKEAGYTDMIVGIKSSCDNQFLIVEVTDNGMGISNDDIHNVMLPFYTTKETGMGTGLGLSICYQIMKEMNGSIEITSDVSFGTKIKLVLNIQQKNS
jgi:PAS domain S-box-containing protein